MLSVYYSDTSVLENASERAPPGIQDVQRAEVCSMPAPLRVLTELSAVLTAVLLSFCLFAAA